MSGGGAGAGPCGACKFLRRKCVNGCIFAPHFDSEQGAAHFAAVHKVFGASNVSKLLLHVPPHKRHDAVVTICYEAQVRLRDPVYGCVAHIFALQQQVVTLQAELAYMQAQLPTLDLPPPPQLTPVPAPSMPLSMSDLPTSSNFPGTFDLPTLGYPLQSPWQDMAPLRNGRNPPENVTAGGTGDLQALARELLNRRQSTADPSTKARSN